MSLAGLLLEQGEEDLAVLLARSDLPEEIDSEHDADRLRQIGLSDDDLRSMLPAVVARADDDRPRLSERQLSLLQRTISERWADLVDQWVGRTSA
jgi:hypothetical protein